MKHKDLATKERIVAATISLILENKDLVQIPISSIAARAEVGIGLINYHFQTKENLINLCVLQVVGQMFGSFDEISEKLAHLLPVDKLKSLIKFITAFMVANPELSRISTLTDLTNGKENDNSSQVMNASYPFLKEAFGETKSEEELSIILQLLISTIQVAFLRQDVNKKVSGFDFFDEAQRERFIDNLIDLLG